jgi:hypothetical protein
MDFDIRPATDAGWRYVGRSALGLDPDIDL